MQFRAELGHFSRSAVSSGRAATRPVPITSLVGTPGSKSSARPPKSIRTCSLMLRRSETPRVITAFSHCSLSFMPRVLAPMAGKVPLMFTALLYTTTS